MVLQVELEQYFYNVSVCHFPFGSEFIDLFPKVLIDGYRPIDHWSFA